MKIKDILEGYEIRNGLKFTLPPTYIMTDLPNNDAYRQYRHLVALAAARANSEKDTDTPMTDESAWGENQTVVCYVPEDYETLVLANKIMGVDKKALTATPSQEAPWRDVASPVRKFVDIIEAAQKQK
jgi:hypothetical protein